MAVTAPKKSKVTMYKMVSLPSGGGSSKDAGMKASQVSYRSFTIGLNRIGATINSTIVVNRQIRDALIQNLKLKDKEFEEEKKRFQKEKEEKNKMKKGGGFPSLGVGKVASKMAGGFFEGLARLGGALMKFVISQAILRWIGNPANMEKLIKIVQAVVNIVTFFSRFLRDNIVKVFEGLATMLDGKKNIFEKLGGFVTFITGFGAILGASLILKKPGLVLKGVGWVLKTLYSSLFKSKARLAKQVASGGAASGGGFGAWSASQGGKGATNAARGGGGRFGALAKGALATAAIAVPMVVGAQMASGPDEFTAEPGSSAAGGGGGGGKPKDNDARLAFGGVATRPTSAVIGERGPEVRMPLDNAKRMRDSGIKPLSSLGGMFGGGDSKKTKKLSDLFMAPFRGIGAGILANISNVVTGMGAPGKALTPIIGNIIEPVANSFGVPPSLVKKLTSKAQGFTSTLKDKSAGAIGKLFGRGKLVDESGKKFRKVTSDTSVLGLLSNMLGAVQVIGNKIGGTSSGPGPGPADTTGTPAPSPSAVEAEKQGAKPVDMEAKGATKAMEAGKTSENREQFSSKAEDADRKNLKFKAKNKEYIALLNTTNGDFEVYNSMLGHKTTQANIKGKENAWLEMAARNEVRAYYLQNDKARGLALKYITQDDVNKKTAPKKAEGGWISGPMSGYPVSLDGGGSTAFIGHGTEWVGFKKAAEGGAFVVPFDTPATKNNPGLTGSRMRQAKQGGYALPGYAKGGEVKDAKGSGDKGLKTATSGGAVITSNYGPRWGRFHAGIDLAGVPIGTPITSLTGGKVLYASTYSGYGNTVDLEVKPGKVLRFAHLDGFLVKKGDVIQPGTKIGTLGNTGVGTGPHLHYEHRKKLSFGQDGAMDPLKTGALKDITIGGKPIVGAKAGQSDDQDQGEDIKVDGEEPQQDPFQVLESAISKLNQTLGYAPKESVAGATEATAKAKDDKAAATKKATTEAAAEAVKQAAGKPKQATAPAAPSPPILLPGPSTTVPIELAWGSTTSLYQPKIGAFS